MNTLISLEFTLKLSFFFLWKSSADRFPETKENA